MACTVFANDNGLFHKGSGGKAVAFPDVCLSPPPAPTGPVPVPYPNKVSASDLAKGSKSVKIQGKPTALKDKSYVKTSTGNEAGNQGGGVVTHKTKGKGYFKFWSFDVKIEGLNVVCHGDPISQNCPSSTFNGLCMRLKTVREAVEKALRGRCKKKYSNDEHHKDPNAEQQRESAAEFERTGCCWDCKRKMKYYNVDDHQPPLVVLWYAGGCHKHGKKDKDGNDQWDQMAKNAKCKPHCQDCSNAQSTDMRRFSADQKARLNL